ncbi:hypothetical protein [Candidatus Magnetobacterium casense]|uniref:Uncharacterized protein n=1 Tax=Candidatus Magnetobacterium casense TaxID=1455061 RepID=A0ABS6RV76_9BACT|nr:hypothetical protein [Candidatus Magnetobacterium casensis]MBV6340178.1 hypothetical protein [Candidatus Magnetobacterium casensis]
MIPVIIQIAAKAINFAGVVAAVNAVTASMKDMNTEIAATPHSALPVLFNSISSGLTKAASFVSVGFATDVAKIIEGSIEAAIATASPKINSFFTDIVKTFTLGKVVSEVTSAFEKITTESAKFKKTVEDANDTIEAGVDAATAIGTKLEKAASNKLEVSLDNASDAAQKLSKKIDVSDSAEKFASAMKTAEGAIEVAVISASDLNDKISDEEGVKVLAKSMEDVNVNIEASIISARNLTNSISPDKAVNLKKEINEVNSAMTKIPIAARDLTIEIGRSAKNSEALKNITNDVHRLTITQSEGVKKITEAFQSSAEAARLINLPLEQAYKITKDVYQTMTNMGLPMRNLNREVTAMFGGRINTGKTQLAGLLGISQDMLKVWQNNGTIVDQLALRLDTFVATMSDGDAAVLSLGNAFSFVASKLKSSLDVDSIFDVAKTKLAAFLVDLNKMDVGPGIKNITDAFSTIFSSLSGKTSGGLGGVFSSMIDHAIASVKKLNDYIGTIDVKAFLDNAINVVNDAISFISAGVNKIFDALKSTFTGLKLDQYFKLALPVLKSLWDGVIKIGQAIINVATTIVPKLVSALSSKALNLTDGLNLSAITESIGKVVNFIVERINNIKGTFDKVFPIVVKYINEWTPAIKKFLAEILKHLPTLVDMAIAYLKVKLTIDNIKSATTSLLPKIIAIGTKILLWAAAAKLFMVMMDVLSPIVQGVKDFFVAIYDAVAPIVLVIYKWNTIMMQLPFKLIMSLVNLLMGDTQRAGQYLTQWNVSLGGTWVLVKDVLGVVWNIAKFFMQLAFAPILGVLTLIGNVFKMMWSDVKAVWDAIKLAGEALKDMFLDGTNLAIGFSKIKIAALELWKVILQIPIINRLVDPQTIIDLDQSIAAEKSLYSATVDIEQSTKKVTTAQASAAKAVAATGDELRDANGKFIEAAEATDIFSESTGAAAKRIKELSTKFNELEADLDKVESTLKQQSAWNELEIKLKYVGTPTGGEEQKKALKELEAEHERVYDAMTVKEKTYTNAVKTEVMDANKIYEDEIKKRMETIDTIRTEMLTQQTAKEFIAMQKRINSEQEYIEMARLGQEALLKKYLDVMKERLDKHQETLNKMVEVERQAKADIEKINKDIEGTDRDIENLKLIGLDNTEKEKIKAAQANNIRSKAEDELAKGNLEKAKEYAKQAADLSKSVAESDASAVKTATDAKEQALKKVADINKKIKEDEEAYNKKNNSHSDKSDYEQREKNAVEHNVKMKKLVEERNEAERKADEENAKSDTYKQQMQSRVHDATSAYDTLQEVHNREKKEAEERWKESQETLRKETAAIDGLKVEIVKLSDAFTAIPTEKKSNIIFEQTGLEDIKKSIAEIMANDGKTIHIKVEYTEQGSTKFSTHHEGGLIYPRARTFADGGKVPGAGDTDTVPAMLTPGEFVINKKAVENIGVPLLTAINNMRVPDSVYNLVKVIRFADGGLVNPPVTSSTGAGGVVTGEQIILNLKLGDTVIQTTTAKANKGVLQQLVKEIEQQKRRGYQ